MRRWGGSPDVQLGAGARYARAAATGLVALLATASVAGGTAGAAVHDGETYEGTVLPGDVLVLSLVLDDFTLFLDDREGCADAPPEATPIYTFDAVWPSAVSDLSSAHAMIGGSVAAPSTSFDFYVEVGATGTEGSEWFIDATVTMHCGAHDALDGTARFGPFVWSSGAPVTTTNTSAPVTSSTTTTTEAPVTPTTATTTATTTTTTTLVTTTASATTTTDPVVTETTFADSTTTVPEPTTTTFAEPTTAVPEPTTTLPEQTTTTSGVASTTTEPAPTTTVVVASSSTTTSTGPAPATTTTLGPVGGAATSTTTAASAGGVLPRTGGGSPLLVALGAGALASGAVLLAGRPRRPLP
jgi:hypothetical protein